jgi:hypothetical protein
MINILSSSCFDTNPKIPGCIECPVILCTSFHGLCMYLAVLSCNSLHLYIPNAQGHFIYHNFMVHSLGLCHIVAGEGHCAALRLVHQEGLAGLLISSM